MSREKPESKEIKEAKKAMREENQEGINVQGQQLNDDLSILGQLRSLVNKEVIVSIYSDYERVNKFCSGFIVGVSEEEVLLAHISPSGLYDGYLIKKIEDIFLIHHDGRYEKRLLALYKHSSQHHKTVDVGGDSLCQDLLVFAKRNHLVISAELYDSGFNDVQGYILEVNDLMIKVYAIDEYGNDNGINVFKIESIAHLACDSEDEITLKRLNEIGHTLL